MAVDVAPRNRRVYSAEELQRLRNSSCPQLRLDEAIEEHGQGDAETVKEHVLRGSRSFAARSWRSRVDLDHWKHAVDKENAPPEIIRPKKMIRDTSASNSALAVPSQNVTQQSRPSEMMIPQHIRNSPTPSVKRRKVEAILKSHGSPTHVRVTAGGRIVPKEQSPLCQPRYGYSAIKANGGLIKFAPNRPLGKTEWMQATQNGFIAQDIYGRMCQIVNGTVLPLTEVNGALKLHIPAPNLNITPQDFTQSLSKGPLRKASEPPPSQAFEPNHILATTTPEWNHARALEAEYGRLDTELKNVDKTEVIHGRTMNKVGKEELISKRRHLVTALDQVRKSLKSALQGNNVGNLTYEPPVENSTDIVQTFAQQSHLARPFLPGHFDGNSFEPPLDTSIANAHVQLPVDSTRRPGYEQMYDGNHDGRQGWASTDHNTYFYPSAGQTYLTEAVTRATMTRQSTQQQALLSTVETDARLSGEPPTRWNQNGTPSSKSPRRSHALAIKSPSEESYKERSRSILNPTSPIYKPICEDSTGQRQSSNSRGLLQGPDGKSPKNESLKQDPSMDLLELAVKSTDGSRASKQNGHHHSSSTTSFGTADFFPSNTHEYSSRSYAYTSNIRSISGAPGSISPNHQFTPESPRFSETKSHSDSASLKKESDDNSTLGAAHHAQSVSTLNVTTDELRRQIPSRVPATMLTMDGAYSSTKDFVTERQGTVEDKRHDTEADNLPPSGNDAQRRTESIDFTMKSCTWIEGYQAGLNGRRIENFSDTAMLDGYCSGILMFKRTHDQTPSNTTNVSSIDGLKSQPQSVTLVMPHVQIIAREPVASLGNPREGREEQPSSLLEQTSHKNPTAGRICHGSESPFDSDILPEKRGMVAESAEELPHPAEFGTPSRQRTEQKLTQSVSPLLAVPPPHIPARASSEAYAYSGRPTSCVAVEGGQGEDLDSCTIDGQHDRLAETLGRRVMSCMSKRTMDAIYQDCRKESMLNLEGQLDGDDQSRPERTCRSPRQERRSHFREADFHGEAWQDLARTTDSPPTSPDNSPAKSGRSYESPKIGTPTRAKFEQLAEKVGIRSPQSSKGNEHSGSPSKRRWRDVWRNSARKPNAKDE